MAAHALLPSACSRDATASYRWMLWSLSPRWNWVASWWEIEHVSVCWKQRCKVWASASRWERIHSCSSTSGPGKKTTTHQRLAAVAYEAAGRGSNTLENLLYSNSTQSCSGLWFFLQLKKIKTQGTCLFLQPLISDNVRLTGCEDYFSPGTWWHISLLTYGDTTSCLKAWISQTGANLAVRISGTGGVQREAVDPLQHSTLPWITFQL